MILIILISLLVLLIIGRIIVIKMRLDKPFKTGQYGFLNNKKIDYDKVPLFRDIPFDGDIWYANALIMLNNLNFKKSNILGVLMLKWVNEGILTINENNLILKKDAKFNDYMEAVIYNMLDKYSNHGEMTIKEFKMICKKNYIDLYIWFTMAIENEIERLKKSGLIHYHITKKECKKEYVMEDRIYDDSVTIIGLKKYMEELGNMAEKDLPEVHLWNNYLVYAALFGNTKKVSKVLNINKLKGVNLLGEDIISYIDKLLSSTVGLLSFKLLTTRWSYDENNSRKEFWDSFISELSSPVHFPSFGDGGSDGGGSDSGHSHGGGGHGSFGGGGRMGGR